MRQPDYRERIAERIARDLEDGWVVNLGIGMPEAVANYVSAEKEIIYQSENGILGMGPAALGDDIDQDLINAGKKPVTALPGASYFNHAESFAMIRGGHLDVSVLGAYQVSASGDLANWNIPGSRNAPSVGGAMDLAVGARNVFVMMRHRTRLGEPKIVENCDYPITGIGVVNRIYTDLAVIDVTNRGLVVTEIISGVSEDQLKNVTAAPIIMSPEICADQKR